MKVFGLAAVLMASAIASCSSSGDDSLRVATYNAGLANGFVSYTDERAPLTLEEIGKIDADILCLQEVWRDDHYETLQTELPSTATVSRFEPAQESGGAGCGAAEAATLRACIDENCEGEENLQSCAFASCSDEINALSPDCIGCLGANIALNNIAAIEAACIGDDVGKYVYGGSYGVALSTTLDVTSSDSFSYGANLIRNGVLYAEVEAPKVGTVHVFCTHLKAVFDDIPYPVEGGSWEEEQDGQIDELLTFIDQKTQDGDAILLLGDFNNGPDTDNASGAVATHYQKIIDAGFINSYLQEENSCTWCADNSLIGEGPNQLIDHVLSKGPIGLKDWKQELTAPLDINTDDGAVTTNYSDHFGLSATLDPPAAE